MNGTGESRLHKRSKSSLRLHVGAGPRHTIFTLIGRINRWKGHFVFIEAAEFLATEFEHVRFLVVGDSFSGQERLSEAVDRRIQSSDVLKGRMARLPHIAEVGSVYAASDIIVVPSTEPEPFGLVAVEAMAAGLPVIASRVGALPEIIDDNRTGFLVEPNNSAALLAAMKELIVSPHQQATMGREGRKRFESCFRVERYVDEFAGLYKEILEG